jgi:hypothetical protein
MVGSIVGAMTPVIFITISFLSCWFLLYALMEWPQDRHREPRGTGGPDKKISCDDHRRQRIVNLRSNEGL